MSVAAKLSHWFVTNRAISGLLLVSVVLFGLIAFFVTPKQYNPEISRPAFVVTMPYAGATTDAAIDRVAQSLIEAVGVIPGVEDVYATVTDGSVITTTAIFAVGTDAIQARVQLWTELMQRERFATGFIGTPEIRIIDPETIPVLQVVFSHADVPISVVRETVQQMVPQLLAVPGVSDVTVTGGYTPAVTVMINPPTLAAAQVSPTDIAVALEQAQTRSVIQETIADTPVVVQELRSTVDSVDALGALPLSPTLQLRDVATVGMMPAGARTYVRHYAAGHESAEVVMLAVAKVEGASAPAVTSAVQTAIAEATAERLPALSYLVVANDGVVADAEIRGLTVNLLTSIVIVAAVLWLFLSTRAAVVVLLAIPLTLLVVLIVGWLFDQTINRITLFALILSLGLLVDSAIVVTENIYRQLRQLNASSTTGMTNRTIATAVGEIAMGLVLSTVTSVIVFLPLVYITGMMGPYMGPIAFFVPVALTVSLFVALVSTPVLAAWLLPVGVRESYVPGWFERQLSDLTNWYQTQLQQLLSNRRRQRMVLSGALLLFILSLILPATALVHFQMLPRADRDQIYVYLDLPLTTPVATTDVLTNRVINQILMHPEVVSVQSFIGVPPIIDFNGLFKGADQRSGTHQATLRVNLTASDTRDESSTAITSALRQRMATELPADASVIRFIEEPPGPPVQATFVAKIHATNAQLERQVAAELADWLPQVTGVVDQFQTPNEPIARAVHTINLSALMTHGVSPATVHTALRLQAAPQPVGEWLQSPTTEQSPIYLAVTPEWSAETAGLSWPVPSKSGVSVPLGSLVTTTMVASPLLTQLEGNRSVTYVTAEIEGRSIVYVMIEIIHRLVQGDLSGYEVSDWSLFGLTLHTTVGEEIIIDWGGEWEMTLENFRDLGLAMSVALLLVYFVLVAQYRTFATPAFILVTIPLGLVGILIGFTVLDTMFGIYLTATALIGFIALIGIVVNNAIIYLEAVTQARSAGASLVVALVEAGGTRLRPILLTSLTTILGSLTIAGDPVWSGLAWAIVFGLSLSTILTLVIYPTLLVYFRVDQTPASPGR